MVYCEDTRKAEVALFVQSYVDDHDCAVAMACLRDNLSVEVELVFHCFGADLGWKGAKAYLGDIPLGVAGLPFCYLVQDAVLREVSQRYHQRLPSFPLPLVAHAETYQPAHLLL